MLSSDKLFKTIPGKGTPQVKQKFYMFSLKNYIIHTSISAPFALVHRLKGKSIAMMSLAEYNAIQETLPTK